jgi:hypothetical protein
MSWFDFLRNPNEIYIKKYIFDILQEKYGKHEKFVEQFSKKITSKEELEDFGKLIAEIYECGFLKAFNDYKKQIEKFGYKIEIGASPTEQKNTSKIFKN